MDKSLVAVTKLTDYGRVRVVMTTGYGQMVHVSLAELARVIKQINEENTEAGE